MKYFDDFSIGDEQLFPGEHVVTDEEIIDVGVK